ncbi:hypothetical protein B0H13DRAFT_466741 [Mycena leptocephala]|nr:hypothetical protein B0H13DRAFT_466741 [Mycena leptocephala]
MEPMPYHCRSMLTLVVTSLASPLMIPTGFSSGKLIHREASDDGILTINATFSAIRPKSTSFLDARVFCGFIRLPNAESLAPHEVGICFLEVAVP